MSLVNAEDAVFQVETHELLKKMVPVITGQPVARTLAAAACVVIGCARSLGLPKERILALIGELYDKQGDGKLII